MIRFCFRTKNGVRAVDLDDVLTALDITDYAGTVSLCLESDGRALKAQASDDPTYPGITLDAVDENDENVYLTMAELPNPDNPDAFAARLYAGYAECETDEPIALVVSKLRSSQEISKLADKHGPKPRKTLYVDQDLAHVVDYFMKNSDDPVPEHTDKA